MARPETLRRKRKLAEAEAGARAEGADARPGRERPAKGKDADGEAEAEAAPRWRNKEKVLVLCSRGVTYRYRHLMEDIASMLPHSKKDAKLDTKKDLRGINELADLKGCSSCCYFEVKKKKDLYIWLSKSPHGPSAKFHVTNVHTMEEMKLVGNHLKGSRPVLSFSRSFDELPHLQVLKEMLTQVFAVPRGHHKMKPFVDHVTSFSVADGCIWMRNYQITEPTDAKANSLEGLGLVEVGPRACLNPIKVFAGSFGGATLYANGVYVSPNAVRAEERRNEGTKYASKVQEKSARKKHVAANPPLRGEFDGMFAP